MNRREFFVTHLAVACAVIESACVQNNSTAGAIAPTPVVSNPAPGGKLEPRTDVANAVLTHYGYADGNTTLLQTMQQAGFVFDVRKDAIGSGTEEFTGEFDPFGWVFLVQNNFIGYNLATSTQRLNKDDLWAAYKKNALG